MAETENVFDVGTDFPNFLNSALEWNQSASSELKQGYLELLDYTIKLLEELIEYNGDMWA